MPEGRVKRVRLSRQKNLVNSALPAKPGVGKEVLNDGC